MLRYFEDPHRTHTLGDTLLTLGLALLAVGVMGGYVIDGRLSLSAQVFAHVLVILGPTLVKVGYVMRINARHRLHLAY
ncbi:transmembrane sensor/regulator PpyR [Halomonas sp. NO4]|uniref:transmembrane sensor/regulator PpyR n=1 Tax=Halomonas sp. NO4 TaxID=2484813 RepID=UPI0013D82B62|nr:transmembrane sensor/regulator PpyR [Halomonas sp. NO4]